jgi:hypothetical protein
MKIFLAHKLLEDLASITTENIRVVEKKLRVFLTLKKTGELTNIAGIY